ncbi:phospholipase B [Scheffersomyces coipomensis]|uniref:phospholipase B n=1 Tax=Scheffersomyces coipomensis TaxID=1788519 RepID=UPI00315D83CA
MKLISLLILLFASLVSCSSPTGGYAPGIVQCPLVNSSFVREANSISQQEQDWLVGRQAKTKQALISFLDSANLTSDASSLFTDDNSTGVNIGLAFSGGSYRAMLSNAGNLMALDDRTTFSDDNIGSLGGILQSSNYISALSGGAWMLGSLVMQDFASVQDILFENSETVWNITSTRQLVNMNGLWTIIFPVLFDNLNGALTHLNFWSGPTGIGNDIASKQAAGFETTLTDSWARALAHQLVPEGNDNFQAGATWSDIRNMTVFTDYDMPFPLVVALGRKPGSTVYNLNSTTIEMNPFEMGSFDPSLNSFVDIEYIGTNMTNGFPTSLNKCVKGFDNAGYIIGTSSSLFNEFLNTLVCDDCNSLNVVVKWLIKKFLTYLSSDYYDVANYKPNPFYQSEYAGSTDLANDDTLYLIDGGLAGEIMPMSNLMTKERELDVVFAFDQSNDDGVNWPNGSGIISTYEKQFSEQGSSTLCPYVPDQQTFLALNLTARPVFFGCNASNLTALVKDGVTPPVMIYVPNRPYEFYSNTSTFQLTYTDEQKKGMIQNGFDVATRLNGTADASWKTCVACALIRREEERRGIEQSPQCQECFQNYCWDGSLANVETPYYPPVNFTNSGLTNGTTEFYGPPPGPSTSTSLLSLIFKREDVEIKETSGSSSLLNNLPRFDMKIFICAALMFALI